MNMLPQFLSLHVDDDETREACLESYFGTTDVTRRCCTIGEDVLAIHETLLMKAPPLLGIQIIRFDNDGKKTHPKVSHLYSVSIHLFCVCFVEAVVPNLYVLEVV